MSKVMWDQSEKTVELLDALEECPNGLEIWQLVQEMVLRTKVLVRYRAEEKYKENNANKSR